MYEAASYIPADKYSHAFVSAAFIPRCRKCEHVIANLGHPNFFLAKSQVVFPKRDNLPLLLGPLPDITSPLGNITAGDLEMASLDFT